MRTGLLSVGCVALALCVAVSGLGGCSGEKSGEKAGKPVVALVMKSLANEFFMTMENGAREHQKAHAADYDLIAQGIKDELDVQRQIQLVEQMVAQGVDAIVIAPADSKALVNACKKAQEAGIVVVNIDNRLDPDVMKERGVTVPFVGPDNRKGARAVAAFVASKLTAGDPVAIVEGVPGVFNGEQRKLGFQEALVEAKLNIVTSQTGSWETAKANEVVSAMLTAHPEIKAVLCANDSMALGAVAALRAADRLSNVLVCGFDNISAVTELIQKGEIAATGDQHAGQVAVYGIEYALNILRGQEAPVDRETPVDLITKVN